MVSVSALNAGIGNSIGIGLKCGIGTSLLSRDEGMAEDHGAPEAGNFPEPGPEVVERQRVVQERAAQSDPSWTVHNEMRGVLGRMSAGAA